MSVAFSFKLTSSATDALERLLDGINDIHEPVIALARDGGGLNNAGWGIGIYEKENLMVSEPLILKISGFEFYFDTSVQQELTDCTLDFEKGHFKVCSTEIGSGSTNPES